MEIIFVVIPFLYCKCYCSIPFAYLILPLYAITNMVDVSVCICFCMYIFSLLPILYALFGCSGVHVTTSLPLPRRTPKMTVNPSDSAHFTASSSHLHNLSSCALVVGHRQHLRLATLMHHQYKEALSTLALLLPTPLHRLLLR